MAPAALKATEVAYVVYNEADNVLYIGFGGNGNATTIVALAGEGVFATKQFVNDAVGNAGGDMLKSVYDQLNKWLKSAGTAGQAPTWVQITKADVGLGNVDNTAEADKPVSAATQTALDAKAPIASLSFTGNPTAPTQTQGNSSTRLATTAFVQAELERLIGTPPGTLDTLQEIAAALGEDPNFAATITASLASKLTAANNLSDLTNAAAARDNLELGAMETQSSDDVEITDDPSTV